MVEDELRGLAGEARRRHPVVQEAAERQEIIFFVLWDGLLCCVLSRELSGILVSDGVYSQGGVWLLKMRV